MGAAVSTPETPAPEVAEERTAEPAQDAPPTPPAETPAAGGDQEPDAEGGKPDVDLTPAEAAIKAEVERRVQEELEQERAKLTQRQVQRETEQSKAEKERQQYYDRAETQSRAAAQTLQKLAQDGEFITDQHLNEHITPMLAGALAMAARENEQAVAGLLDVVLPNATDEELSGLDEAYYDFRRNGRIGDYLQKMFEAGVARRDAEIKGLQKQLRDRKGLEEAAALLAKGAEAAGPGVGAETPQGASVQGGPLTAQEAQTLSID